MVDAPLVTYVQLPLNLGGIDNFIVFGESHQNTSVLRYLVQPEFTVVPREVPTQVMLGEKLRSGNHSYSG